MKRLAYLSVLFCLFAAFSFADEADKAIGYWKSVSDVKGEVGKITAYWKLTVNDSGVLEGVIVHVPEKSDSEVYACVKKEFDGKPVLNTAWIKNMKKTSSSTWGGGTIVDVGNNKGDVYGCEMKVTKGGTILEMRGFMGVSLLGRSQFWQRSSEDELKAAQEQTQAKLGN